MGLFICCWPGMLGCETKELVMEAILCSGDREPTRSTSAGGKSPEPGPLPKNSFVFNIALYYIVAAMVVTFKLGHFKFSALKCAENS